MVYSLCLYRSIDHYGVSIIMWQVYGSTLPGLGVTFTSWSLLHMGLPLGGLPALVGTAIVGTALRGTDCLGTDCLRGTALRGTLDWADKLVGRAEPLCTPFGLVWKYSK
jgi:hypothetical protein